ncbi:MAG: hypothetical protein LBD57_05200, partial [Endomicrobium sp.]|uniref:hypothetical protein n=1 Tax=Candidatus Endomicrobiellum cubanum TaxID=3242325 RepID=UPI0028366D45|nr:hypothetical protein [Endomicrobium sp.]
MSKCFNLCKVLKEYLFYAVLLTITLTLFCSAQIIEILNPPSTGHGVAGNSVYTSTGTPNYGVVIFDFPWQPANFGESSGNTIIIRSTMPTKRLGILGSLNYPFDQNSVNTGSTNVALKPDIICSSNSVIIYNDVNNNSIFGSYSLLNDALANNTFTPSSNTINSTFSFTNNSVTISSFSNISFLESATISLSLNSGSLMSLNLTSSFYLDNNNITINSSCSVSYIYGAHLELSPNNSSTLYSPHTISISSNTIEINQPISNCIQISLAYLSLPNNDIQNLYVTDNRISISTSNLNLSDIPISLVYSNPSINLSNIV